MYFKYYKSTQSYDISPEIHNDSIKLGSSTEIVYGRPSPGDSYLAPKVMFPSLLAGALGAKHFEVFMNDLYLARLIQVPVKDPI